jgi:hypothetical protein
MAVVVSSSQWHSRALPTHTHIQYPSIFRSAHCVPRLCVMCCEQQKSSVRLEAAVEPLNGEGAL